MPPPFDNLAQLGVGGIFALLLIREVLHWVGKKNNTQNGTDTGCTAYMLMETVKTQNKAILRLLEQGDETGRIVHRVEKALDRLDNNRYPQN